MVPRYTHTHASPSAPLPGQLRPIFCQEAFCRPHPGLGPTPTTDRASCLPCPGLGLAPGWAPAPTAYRVISRPLLFPFQYAPTTLRERHSSPHMLDL